MTVIEGKSAYPYLTIFKKEPFKSFVLVPRKQIKSFYFSEYNKVVNFYQHFNKDLFNDKSLNLENVFWFLLLRKYLREDKKENDKEILNFITKCEFPQTNKLGFKFSPNSQRPPDIWSTFFALASIKLLGKLKEYLSSKGDNQIKQEIKNFILEHKKGNGFLHCLGKNCEICKKTSTARTIYCVIEIFTLLGLDVRKSKEEFRSYIGDRKRDPSIVFKLSCLKLIDLDSVVKDKEIKYLHQFEKENGGFSFKNQVGKINTTFWVVYVLENYSWLLDYNPAGIYSFINNTLNKILTNQANWNLILLMEVSKLIILLSLIWAKFIEEIERILFKQLEKEGYIDIKQLINTFNLSNIIEEIILYINLNYNFNLKILDNKIEFLNYTRGLSSEKLLLATTIREELSNKSIISLSNIIKKYNIKFRREHLKIKDIRPIINEMIDRNFFKGSIRAKKGFSLRTKYYFYLDFFLEKIIISDAKIDTERLFYEKEKLKDIKNDIYNMTLNLKNTSLKIREEIESYIILDEIAYAKERLKYILRNALMEADFLNENIETSFNEDLYYINIQAILATDIASWKIIYSLLQKRLNEIDSYLKGKIIEKEESRNLNKILEKLEDRIYNIEENINKKLDSFKIFFRETLEKGYSIEKFELIVQEFNKIVKNFSKYDNAIYKISQKVTTQERKLIKKHKKTIAYWISIKEDLEIIFDYYLDGFRFFKKNDEAIEKINEEFKKEIITISESVKSKINENKIQEIFNTIKTEFDALLKTKTIEIKELQGIVKKEIKSKQKFYLLFRLLKEKLDKMEEEIINLVAEQVQSLKNKVIEDKNRAKIEEFDNFISENVVSFKEILNAYKINLDQSNNLKINGINKGFDKIQKSLSEKDKLYNKKLNNYKNSIQNFTDKSSVTIVQWEKFKEYFNNEINNLRNDYVNMVITDRINVIVNQKKSNNIDIKDLKVDLSLSCNVLIDRIKDMIEISKLNAQLYEDEKCIIVHTEHFYKNKELKNYLNNQLFKKNREPIGKILALYDSSIRNRTLSVNMLELQNRIKELKDFEKITRVQFNNKIIELQINQERKEFIETEKYFNFIIENDIAAINSIKNNLILFNDLQNLVCIEYDNLKTEITHKFVKKYENIEEPDSFIKIKENFENKRRKFEYKLKRTHEKIEEELKLSTSKNNDSIKLCPEIGEFYVKKRNEFLKIFEKKMEKVNEQIFIIKNEFYRGKLTTFITNRKIHLSQLLGTIERRVEDYIEIKEFKKALTIISKRTKNIESQIKEINKSIKNTVKDFNKHSRDFETKNKYIIDNFNQFIFEFLSILSEKVKALEQLILKSYIQMAIKAVANEYLTIGFLNNELKIKKQNIQDHLLFLISSGNLKGKYDPRIGVYYEKPEIVNNLEDNLEVIKKMNFKVYMFLNRLKNFTGQYYSIIAFFASLLTISYYLFLLSGSNPAVVAVPIIIIISLLSYLFFKRRKEEKIKY
ncbi:MAG: prenyltransferase/squalene oxidase repeat-containing protein [Promethearchaeota archaeon]